MSDAAAKRVMCRVADVKILCREGGTPNGRWRCGVELRVVVTRSDPAQDIDGAWNSPVDPDGPSQSVACAVGLPVQEVKRLGACRNRYNLAAGTVQTVHRTSRIGRPCRLGHRREARYHGP